MLAQRVVIVCIIKMLKLTYNDIVYYYKNILCFHNK